jgi:hypothetical protein
MAYIVQLTAQYPTCILTSACCMLYTVFCVPPKDAQGNKQGCSSQDRTHFACIIRVMLIRQTVPTLSVQNQIECWGRSLRGGHETMATGKMREMISSAPKGSLLSWMVAIGEGVSNDDSL